MGSPGDAGGTPTAAATLAKSTRVLANAETKVRSILVSLENKGSTVDTASEEDMDELEAATAARDWRRARDRAR